MQRDRIRQGLPTYPTEGIQVERSSKYIEMMILGFLRETGSDVGCLRTPPWEVKSKHSSTSLKNAKVQEIGTNLEVFK